MESQPQNPEFRINLENFHTWGHFMRKPIYDISCQNDCKSFIGEERRSEGPSH